MHEAQTEPAMREKRPHPALGGQRDRGVEGGARGGGVGSIAAQGDLAEQTQGPRLPSVLAMLAAQSESPIGLASRRVDVAAQQLRLAEGRDDQRMPVRESDRAGVTVRTLEHRDRLLEPSGEGARASE